MQYSVNSPEALHPDENVRRMTAPILFHLPLKGEGKYWSNALVWGANAKHDVGTQHSLLFESSSVKPFTFECIIRRER